MRLLSPGAGMLRAIAGMVPPGKSDIEPKVNVHHIWVAVQQDGRWQIVLYHNTPAPLHGRPEPAQQMTDELRQLLT